LHQCLLNASIFFEGSPKEILVDNMRTAITERQGAAARFNDAFLDFLRTFSHFYHSHDYTIIPLAVLQLYIMHKRLRADLREHQ